MSRLDVLVWRIIPGVQSTVNDSNGIQRFTGECAGCVATVKEHDDWFIGYAQLEPRRGRQKLSDQTLKLYHRRCMPKKPIGMVSVDAHERDASAYL